MKKIETNEDAEIINCHTHDLIFDKFHFDSNKAVLSLKNEKKTETEFYFNDVEYLQIGELIPSGVVLTCYLFRFCDFPSELSDDIDLTNVASYLTNEDVHIFYADGSLGFELLIAAKQIRHQQANQ